MKLRALALCSLLLVACRAVAGPDSASPDASALEGVELVELVVTPSNPAAERYGERAKVQLSPVEDAMAQAMTHLGLVHDPSLSRMAAELARHAPDRANIPPALVDALATRAGLVDPPPRLVIVEVPTSQLRCADPVTETCRRAVRSLVEQVELAEPVTGRSVYGVGAAALPNGSTRLVVAVLERTIALEPMPIEVPLGASIRVRGRLLGPRTAPSVEVVDPRGRWTRRRTTLSVGGTFEASLRCEAPAGAYQVEVLAEGAYGPEVAANFPIYCGAEVPDRIRVEMERLDPDATPEQLAHANFFYLNEARRQRGLPALAWDREVARVAWAHSRDMMRGGFVGHRSPNTGDVRERFDAAGIDGVVIRENVARGYGPKGIHESLMRSPGHRANMLARDVTHVGIGFVVGPPENSVEGAPRPLFATQNFVRKAGGGAPENARMLAPTLRTHIDTLRADEGLARVAWEGQLHKLAQRLAETLAARGRDPDMLERTLAESGHERLEMRQAQSADFLALAGLPLWREPSLQAGLGVARRGQGDDVRFFLVVLVAQP